MAAEMARKCILLMEKALAGNTLNLLHRASRRFSGHPRGVFPSYGHLGFGEVVPRASPGLSGYPRGAFPSLGLAGAVRGYSTFDQAMQGRLASLAQVKTPYPPMMEDSMKFRNRMAGAPKPTNRVAPLISQAAVEKCELRVHLCPSPWFYNIHGVWIIGSVNGVWIVHYISSFKLMKSRFNIATQQLQMVNQTTVQMMNEYWKSLHGVQSNPRFWIHENAKHSYYDMTTQMPNYFNEVIALGSQTIALLWKLGFEPNAFYERDHFLDVLRKNQGVDVYLDFIEDPTTGIVYLEAFGFYYERQPSGDWVKVDHPTARVQDNAYFYLMY